MSKLVQKCQGYEEALVYQFLKVKALKGADVVHVPLWDVSNLPAFKNFQYGCYEAESRGLAQKKKNILNSIVGHVYQILWWEVNIREESYAKPF